LGVKIFSVVEIPVACTENKIYKQEILKKKLWKTYCHFLSHCFPHISMSFSTLPPEPLICLQSIDGLTLCDVLFTAVIRPFVTLEDKANTRRIVVRFLALNYSKLKKRSLYCHFQMTLVKKYVKRYLNVTRTPDWSTNKFVFRLRVKSWFKIINWSP